MIDLDQPLVDITRMVWRCTLGFDVMSLTEFSRKSSSPHYRATVTIHGAWNGELSLSCPGDLAHRVAGVFFEKTPSEISEAEVRDALGELANMTGGNLKALLPGPCSLSTPRTSRGAETSAAAGSRRFDFACWPQYFTVELTEETRS